MSSIPPRFQPTAVRDRVKVVGSFDELMDTAFGDGINALCWQRALPGDFAEVLAVLDAGEGITTVDEALLLELPLSEAGQVARQILLDDLERLRAHGLSPELDSVIGRQRDPESGLLRTDVASFHVDTATAEADTYLCTYCGTSSEGLLNEDAVRRVDVAETRAELLKHYGGEDDANFLEHLSDHFYDLHYAALPGAQAYAFGRGNLWRIACDYPGSLVPPCIHRAPETLPGDPPRLLLIS